MKMRLIIATSLLILASCGKQPEQNDYEDESKSGTFSGGGGRGASQRNGANRVNIPISVDYGAFGLAGTAATAYTVTLDDDPAGDPGGASTCISAYTATVSEANADIEVYKDDRGCVAKLTTFTVGATTYNATNAGASDFTTWAANDTAIFASAGGDIIRVKVISQLATPIAGTEAVVYNFSELLDGTGDYAFSEAEVSDAHAITVESQEAPHFNVVGATFVGLDDATGAAELSFKLECVDDPTLGSPTSIAMSAGTQANSVCGANDLANIDYKLVIDSYGSTLDATDAEAIFASAGSTITMPAHQYADSATNEGFNTSTLDGPGAIGTAANRNMILILRAGISYTYFNIDVSAITQ